MGARIRGQETEVIILVNSLPQTNLTLVKSFKIEWKLDIQEEGFLGETTQRYDAIFKGITGDMSLQFDSPDIFSFVDTAVARARRRVAGARINIKSTLNFPSGRRARIIVPEVSIGAFPMNIGGREQFIEIPVNFSASEAKVLVA
jgi:hypothetical protein